MDSTSAALEKLSAAITQEFGRLSSVPIASPDEGDAVSGASVRDLFLELLVMAMANLYNKTPLGSQLLDRAMIRAVVGHLPDEELGKLVIKTEDWIRQEGLVRAQEGQKNYSLTREAMAVLSTETGGGTLGQVMERASACYIRQAATPELRRATRKLSAAFLALLPGR